MNVATTIHSDHSYLVVLGRGALWIVTLVHRALVLYVGLWGDGVLEWKGELSEEMKGLCCECGSESFSRGRI